MSGASLMMSFKGGGGVISPGGPLTVVVSPEFLYGFNYGFGTVTSSEAAFATVTGGVPPYTGLWVRTGGSASITAQQGTNNATRFQATLGSGTDVTATWKYTVTDSASTNEDSNIISVTLETFGYPSGGDVP